MNTLLIGYGDKTPYILAHLPKDFLLIDPRGDLAEVVLKRLDPQKTCYLNASDTEYPFGFNPLLHGEPDKIADAFDAIFDEGESTLTRSIASFVFESCLTLKPQTLLGLLDIPPDHDLMGKRFDAARTLLEARLGKLLLKPLLRNILLEPTTFQFGKTIVANLSKIGDTAARLLGCLLIACSKGHVIISDVSFFKMPLPMSENRFTLLARSLKELHPSLLKDIPEIQKVIYRTSLKDAEELSFYLGLLNPRQLTELDEPYGIPPFKVPKARYKISSHVKRSRARHARPK